MNESMIISIVGIDGCGKSSTSKALFESLSRDKKVVYVGDEIFLKENGTNKEPNTRYVNTKYWLRSKAKNTNSRFIYKILKILELIIEDNIVQRLIKKQKPQVIVTDGSPMINILAWVNIYHPEKLTNTTIKKCIDIFNYSNATGQNILYLFKNLKRGFFIFLFKRKFVIPNHIVLLDIKPEIAITRINKRNSKKQMHEHNESLKKLNDGYKVVCSGYEGYTKVHVLDVNRLSFDEVVNKLSTIIYAKN